MLLYRLSQVVMPDSENCGRLYLDIQLEFMLSTIIELRGGTYVDI